jgi:hypothetical protein
MFRPIAHAWRMEVAHGRLGRSRRLARSFENTTISATGWLQVACVAMVLRGGRSAAWRAHYGRLTSTVLAAGKGTVTGRTPAISPNPQPHT